MKGAGYPEDSTQSAYSSQLIRIPLSLSAIIFYLSCFISREASTRQWWGGDRNQLLGGAQAGARTHTPLLPHLRFESDSVCIRYDDECVIAHFSVDTNFQCFLSLCLFPPFVWADCASRLRQSDGEQLLSGKTYERTAAQQPSRKANSFNCSKKKRRGER